MIGHAGWLGSLGPAQIRLGRLACDAGCTVRSDRPPAQLDGSVRPHVKQVWQAVTRRLHSYPQSWGCRTSSSRKGWSR
jgi:hypothetical protein